jgi:DNA repair protein RadC
MKASHKPFQTQMFAIRLQPRMVRDDHVDLYNRPLGEAQDVLNAFRHLSEEPDEHAICIYLSSANTITGYSEIGKGSTDAATASPRTAIRDALLCSATGIIFLHNHPSGSLEPSADDTKVASALRNASKLFDIHLLDALIIGANQINSFLDKLDD